MAHSPLLRAAQLTLQYTQDHGSIPLTASKAFKRVFVHWAAEYFDWPNMGYEELFSVNKVLNEYDFPPLELLHFLLIELKLGRHYKGQFKMALLHKSADGRSCPFPGQTYPTASVTGMLSAV